MSPQRKEPKRLTLFETEHLELLERHVERKLDLVDQCIRHEVDSERLDLELVTSNIEHLRWRLENIDDLTKSAEPSS